MADGTNQKEGLFTLKGKIKNKVFNWLSVEFSSSPVLFSFADFFERFNFFAYFKTAVVFSEYFGL